MQGMMSGSMPGHRQVPPGMQIGGGLGPNSTARGAPSIGQGHLQALGGGRMGQSGGSYGAMGTGVQGQGAMSRMPPSEYATSPQNIGARIGMQQNPSVANPGSYQQQSGMVGNSLGSFPAAGRTGPGFIPPSGDLLSMLNNKGAGATQQREEGSTLSMSDFPSLGGVSTGVQQRTLGQDSPAVQDALLGSVKMPQSPTFGEEDFPALPGGNSHRVSQQGLQQQSQRLVQRPMVQSTVAMGVAPRKTVNPGTGPVAVPSLAPGDKFGLLGLLHVIRMSDPDLTTLALGTDLTTLGLNLNSPEPLWKTFVSPWAEGPSKQELDPRIPDSFLAPAPQMTREHWYHFKPDTLFYIFYGMPGEESQIRAAAELSRRGWMYHKELKAWIARVPNTEPEQKTDRVEVGSFLVFDVLNWEVVRKDGFSLSFDALEESPVSMIKNNV